MSLGSILIIGLLIMLVVVLWMPVQFCFAVQYQKQWCGSLTVNVLFWQYTWHWLDHRRVDVPLVSSRPLSLDLPIPWADMAFYLRRAMHIVGNGLHLEQLYGYFHIGWRRADYTAYSYGLFWAIVSLLPKHWLEKSELLYEPDFSTQSKEVELRGIVCSRGVQIIAMLAALARLVLRMLWQIPRKGNEQL